MRFWASAGKIDFQLFTLFCLPTPQHNACKACNKYEELHTVPKIVIDLANLTVWIVVAAALRGSGPTAGSARPILTHHTTTQGLQDS